MTTTSSLRIVEDIADARATILKRAPLGEPVLAMLMVCSRIRWSQGHGWVAPRK